MTLFPMLQCWFDPVRRTGPQAMAIDEWLLETADLPVLRVYGWLGNWLSVGYFGEISRARAAFPGVEIVRRWTGGGTVDHRHDWTYSLVVPKHSPVSGARGAESYRLIHAALAQALAAEGLVARMSAGEEETGRAICFENPVAHDLLAAGGGKLAGAGQRRSKTGLLHQGSVAIGAGGDARAEAFARCISPCRLLFDRRPDPADIERRIALRYACDEWTERR